MSLLDLLQEGLDLLLIGMGVVFVFLGVLVVAVHWVSCLARTLEKPLSRAPAVGAGSNEIDPDPCPEVVCAISAAVHCFRSGRHE
jgi:oxaloacetate decarboxylase gamma subunit